MLLIALALAATTAAPRRECRGSAPIGCAIVTPLLDHGLPERLRQFLADRSEAYLTISSRWFGHAGWLSFITQPSSIADQMVDVLGGPPGRRINLTDGFLFTACRDRSCDERGSLIVDRIGRILAVGIIHYEAGRSTTPHVNIYVRANLPDSDIRVLESWADHAVLPRQITQYTITRV